MKKITLASLLLAGASSLPLSAADLTWGGTSTLKNWSPTASDTTAPWSDGVTSYDHWLGDTYTAVFGSTAANKDVTVASGVSAYGLTITSSGYSFYGVAVSIGAGGIDTSTLGSGAITDFKTSDAGGAISLTANQTWKLGAGSTLRSYADVARVNNNGYTVTANVASGSSNLETNMAGSGGLIKTGAGNLVLSAGARSTYTGNVDIQAGTLTIGATANANNGDRTVLGKTNTGSKTITVASGATLAGTTNNWFGNQSATVLPTIILNGGNLTTSNYSTVGSLNLNGGTVTSTATGVSTYQGLAFRGTITVGGSAASTISYTGTAPTSGYHLADNTEFNVADATGSAATDLTVSAGLRNQSADFSNAAGGLTKTGAGTMVLGGANTYTGATAVSAGTLLINGSTSTGAMSVASGGRLGGTGTIGGATTVSGGGTLLAGAGSASGSLTIGNALTLGDNSKIELTLGSGLTSSTLARTGGTWVFDADQLFVISGSDFTIGTYQNVISGLTGSESGLGTIGTWSISGGTVQGTFSYDGAGGVDLQVTTVPEPGTWALVALGGVMVMTVARRRKLARQ